MSAADLALGTDQEKVQQVLARLSLPKEVESVETKFGQDHAAAPAVFLSFRVRKTAKVSPKDLERLSRFLSEVMDRLFEANVEAFPYPNLEQED